MKKNTGVYALLTVLVLFSFGLLFFSSRLNSITSDEEVHIVAGYSYLKTADFRLDPEHPPLMKELAALPLLVLKPKIDLSADWAKASNFYYDSWKEARNISKSFLYTINTNLLNIVQASRLPFMLLTIILGLAVFYWAKKLYGQKAGLFAAFLILLMPNILAHGILANTDLGVTLFAFLAIYYWVNFLEKRSWPNLLLTGLFLGFAFASKYTSGIFLLIMGILAIVYLFYNQKENRIPFGKVILYFGLTIIIGLFVVWASFGFKVSPPPLTTEGISWAIEKASGYKQISTFDHLYNVVRPIFIPAAFFKGIFLVVHHSISGHYSYMLDQSSLRGWWYYFPVVILLKTPVPFLFFLSLSGLYNKRLKSKMNFQETALIITPAIFLLVGIFSRADLGVRHMLPIFPFLAVYASRSINLIEFRHFNRKLAAALIFSIFVLWYFYGTLRAYPNYIAYFNEFSGRQENYQRIFGDSNLDWGQDMFRIHDYLSRKNIGDGFIIYPWVAKEAFGHYGIYLTPVSGDPGALKGGIVISASQYHYYKLDWFKKFEYDLITPGVYIFNKTE